MENPVNPICSKADSTVYTDFANRLLENLAMGVVLAFINMTNLRGSRDDNRVTGKNQVYWAPNTTSDTRDLAPGLHVFT